MELIERERRAVERRIREARFPAVKSLDRFDFTVIPSLNKMLVLDLARGDFVARRENVIALGNSGTGKTHVVLGLGLAACQHGFSVGFTAAAGPELRSRAVGACLIPIIRDSNDSTMMGWYKCPVACWSAMLMMG